MWWPWATCPRTNLLAWPPGFERGSEHPLAEAIVAGAEARGLTPSSAADFEAVTGSGITGTVDGRSLTLGNAAMLASLHIATEALEDRAETLRGEGKTVMFVSVDGMPAGLIAVADRIKDTTAEAIRALHDSGLRIVMATGDAEATAQAVARTAWP